MEAKQSICPRIPIHTKRSDVMKRRVSAAICVTTAVFIVGCFNTSTVRFGVDEVIWTPKTDVGRAFLERHTVELRDVVESVQTSPQLSGLSLVYELGDAGDTTWYLGLHLTAAGMFNTLRTTYQSRAASAYSNVLHPLAVILAKHESLFGPGETNGAYVWLDWRATDFLSDKYGLMAQTEGMNAWIPDSTLFSFARMRISIQELARQSSFTSTMGRTELDFSNTH
jgi:hypothetical protein